MTAPHPALFGLHFHSHWLCSHLSLYRPPPPPPLFALQVRSKLLFLPPTSTPARWVTPTLCWAGPSLNPEAGSRSTSMSSGSVFLLPYTHAHANKCLYYNNSVSLGGLQKSSSLHIDFSPWRQLLVWGHVSVRGNELAETWKRIETRR